MVGKVGSQTRFLHYSARNAGAPKGKTLFLHTQLKSSAAGTVGVLVYCSFLPLLPGKESLWNGSSLCWGYLKGVLGQKLL